MILLILNSKYYWVILFFSYQAWSKILLNLFLFTFKLKSVFNWSRIQSRDVYCTVSQLRFIKFNRLLYGISVTSFPVFTATQNRNLINFIETSTFSFNKRSRLVSISNLQHVRFWWFSAKIFFKIKHFVYTCMALFILGYTRCTYFSIGRVSPPPFSNADAFNANFWKVDKWQIILFSMHLTQEIMFNKKKLCRQLI